MRVDALPHFASASTPTPPPLAAADFLRAASHCRQLRHALIRYADADADSYAEDISLMITPLPFSRHCLRHAMPFCR